MITTKAFRFPADMDTAFQKAVRLSWWSVGFLLSSILFIYLVMGNSQALRTAWVKEILALFPPVSFLVASRFYRKKPNQRFPYGYHRAFHLAYLSGSLGILTMGVLLLINATRALVTAQHPTMASVTILGNTFWIGWLALVVLLYKALPAYFIGKRKLKLAKLTEDEILNADAIAQKLAYHTSLATAAGIMGVGMGWWWADEITAYFISYTVLREGYINSRHAMLSLMDANPTREHTFKVNEEISDEISEDIQQVLEKVKGLEGVRQTEIRLRKQGHVLFGELYVKGDASAKAIRKVLDDYWRMHDVVVVDVEEMPV